MLVGRFLAFAKFTLRTSLEAESLCLLQYCATAWMAASALKAQPTPTCKGSRYSAAFSRALVQAHLLAKRRKTSPTAIGRTSPPSFLSAWRDAPAMKGAMLAGTRPASRVFKASVRASRAGLWLGAFTPSSRCYGRRQEGPPLEPFGKPPRAFKTSSGVWE